MPKESQMCASGQLGILTHDVHSWSHQISKWYDIWGVISVCGKLSTSQFWPLADTSLAEFLGPDIWHLQVYTSFVPKQLPAISPAYMLGGMPKPLLCRWSKSSLLQFMWGHLDIPYLGRAAQSSSVVPRLPPSQLMSSGHIAHREWMGMRTSHAAPSLSKATCFPSSALLCSTNLEQWSWHQKILYPALWPRQLHPWEDQLSWTKKWSAQFAS
jgi:hypothetical protein